VWKTLVFAQTIHMIFFWLLLRVEEKHNAKIESLEKEWPRYTDKSHHGLSQLPQYTMASASPSLWNIERETETFEEAYESAQLEGETFSRNYLEDVQFILSRTNHHHHKMTKHGRVPLTACKPKGKKNSRTCKAGHPKDKELTGTARIVCKGVAVQVGLRVRGRRNALGAVLGKRNCPWLCGSARILTALVRSNTNTMPNYRVPILPCTHDAQCQENCVTDEAMMQRLCLAASRAAKQTTGYFGGYTSKRQPVGKYELEQSARTLNLLAEKIKGSPPYVQFMRVTSRMMTDLYGKGTLRAMSEEFNLSSNMNRQDATAAEFLRTYQIREFRGSPLLFALENEMQAESKGRMAYCVMPVQRPDQQKRNACPIAWTALYGYRGTDPRVYHMSPWELWTHWDPVRLQAPCFYKEYPLTRWTEMGAQLFRERKAGEDVVFRPGLDFHPVSEPPNDGHSYVVLPRIAGPHAERMECFRAEWILRRASRPCVVAPTSTPLPSNSQSKEQRARICSVYWRPWVFHEAWASREVPRITELNRICRDVAHPEHVPGKRARCKSTTATRSELVGFRAAWKHYVRGNIVSESAAQLIRNFLTACIAYTGQEEDEDEEKTKDKNFIFSQLPLSVNNVHTIIDGMRQREREAISGFGNTVTTISTIDASIQIKFDGLIKFRVKVLSI